MVTFPTFAQLDHLSLAIMPAFVFVLSQFSAFTYYLINCSSLNLHLTFFSISISTLIWLALVALFRVVIMRNSVSLFRFPFPSHVLQLLFQHSLDFHLQLSVDCLHRRLSDKKSLKINWSMKKILNAAKSK